MRDRCAIRGCVLLLLLGQLCQSALSDRCAVKLELGANEFKFTTEIRIGLPPTLRGLQSACSFLLAAKQNRQQITKDWLTVP